MIQVIKKNIDFGYLLNIELLPTFSHFPILIFLTLGTFSQNGSHVWLTDMTVKAY